jgi:hypothetical protein
MILSINVQICKTEAIMVEKAYRTFIKFNRGSYGQ